MMVGDTGGSISFPEVLLQLIVTIGITAIIIAGLYTTARLWRIVIDAFLLIADNEKAARALIELTGTMSLRQKKITFTGTGLLGTLVIMYFCYLGATIVNDFHYAGAPARANVTDSAPRTEEEPSPAD